MGKQIIVDGEAQKYTLENYGFRTDTSKGKPHGIGNALGSVFSEPLFTGDQNDSVWLEHVVGKGDGKALYWLVWYDSEGKPKIPLSAIFGKEQLVEMSKRIAEFVPE
jgi:hypothetical protein